MLLTGLLIYGSKKDHALTTSQLTPDATSADMQAWLGKQNKDSLAIKAASQLLGQARWDLAHSIVADSNTYEIVLLKNTATITFDDPTKAQQRYLVLQKQNNNIINGYIYELFGNKDEIVIRANDAITGF